MSNGDSKKHKFKKGESIEGIAKKYGHRDWKAIWDAKENRKLVQKRKQPAELQPGDLIVIPPNEKQLKEAEKQDKATEDDFAAAMKLVENLEADYTQSVADFKKTKSITQEFLVETKNVYDEFLAIEKKMNSWAFGADVSAVVLTAAESLPKAFQAVEKVSLKFIANLESQTARLMANWKVAKSVVKQTNNAQILKLASEYGSKASSGKDSTNSVLSAVGQVAEFVDKGTRPSFWANLISQKLDGKTWTEAAKSNVGDDIKQQLKEFEAHRSKMLQTLKEHLKADDKRKNDLKKQVEIARKRLT